MFAISSDGGRARLRAIEATGFAFLLASFVISVANNGVPALRHDWIWPSSREGFLASFTVGTSGWSPLGFGSANAYPTTFILSTLLAFIGIIAGPYGAFLTFVVVIGGLATFFARSLVINVGTESIVARVSIAAVALFNPWVLAEIIAGHTYMVLAYVGAIGFLAELLRGSRSRSVALVTTLLLTYAQLQFFLPLVVIAAYRCVRQRDRWPLMVFLFLLCPVVISVFGNIQSLDATLFLLGWQQSMSIDLSQGALLLGYGFGYLDRYLNSGAIPLYLLGIGVIWSIVTLGKNAIVRSLGIVAAFMLVFASGTKGPIAYLYEWLVTHVALVGLYRELYDVIGFVVICYLAIVAVGSRKPPVRAVVAIAAAGLIGLWISSPPSRWWASLASLPNVNVAVGPMQRFALLPAYQPLQFNGRFEGADPNAGLRPGGIAPLNEYFASYPVNRALSELVMFGRTSDLAALGVSQVINRPWLESDEAALRYQGAQPRWHDPFVEHGLIIDGLPLVSLGGTPRVTTMPLRLDANAIFAGDDPSATVRVFRVVPTNAGIDPSAGWIDARLMFGGRPDVAQPFGGAYTTSNLPLALPTEGTRVLVNVVGTLESTSGMRISLTTEGYRWRDLPRTRSVRCLGACAIALTGDVRGNRTIDSSGAYEAADASELAPFVYRVRIPNATSETVRLNVRYAPTWVGFAGWRELLHFRVDGIANEWMLRTPGSQEVWLINIIALAQAIAEVAVLVVVAGYYTLTARTAFKNRGTAG